ncbi:MAG TPA: alkaline phosphatase family protein [Streptosporangiaceae bacterium]
MISRKSRTTSIVLTAATPVALAALALTPAGAAVSHPATVTAAASAAGPAMRQGVPVYSHIVIVMEENHAFSQIIGSSQAPYMNSLAKQGASFTDSHAITHPSEPNYMAFTSGSTYGLTSDQCPFSTGNANLGSELIAAGDSYDGYSEGMPSKGFEGCTSGLYARKHNPTANYTDLPKSVNLPWGQFPTGSTNFASLPTVAIVDPNLDHDMHDGTINQADTWLKGHLNAYLTWAKNNNSLLIVTWDENNGAPGNQVPTIFAGAHIKAGNYSENISHYNVLRTIENAYGLTPVGASASATAITDVFS